MITESIKSPDCLPLPPAICTSTLLAPSPAGPLEPPVRGGVSRFAGSSRGTKQGRRHRGASSSPFIKLHRRQPFRDDPNPRKKKTTGGADRRPETRRFLFHGGRLAGESQPKSQSRGTPQARPAAVPRIPAPFH